MPGGWKDKATLELDMVINQKKALVPVSHKEYLDCVARYGGRVIFVIAPHGWGALGFPETDSSGRRVRYQVVRNVPGRQDAGRIWQT